MTSEVPRTADGDPLILPLKGKRKVRYQRASGWGDALADHDNLTRHLTRLAVKGVSQREDLLHRAQSATTNEKWIYNQIVTEAVTAAGGDESSRIGTMLHEATEAIDLGLPVEPPIPEAYWPDLDAYYYATRPFRHRHVERFMVCDELKVAGTPDRLSELTEVISFGEGEHAVTLEPRPHPAPLLVTDLKTGRHRDFLGKYAVQLAIYAHSDFYDPETGYRTPVELDQDWGVVFYMPAGQGTCDLVALDLKAGWEAALLVADVRAWRERKGVALPRHLEANVETTEAVSA